MNNMRQFKKKKSHLAIKTDAIKPSAIQCALESWLNSLLPRANFKDQVDNIIHQILLSKEQACSQHVSMVSYLVDFKKTY